MTACPFETFPALSGLPVRHAFTGRMPGIDVRIDRSAALERLAVHHAEVRAQIGVAGQHYVTAEQVHGAGVGIVRGPASAPISGVDALITDDPTVCLGIYVADCGPIWLVDPVRRAIGCVHSGRKGTEFGIVTATIEAMQMTYGCKASQMIAQLGPCIRPPHYEIDFAADIVRQCRDAGLAEVHDCGSCTASNEQRYYSYRREKGQTGRMVALLALA